MDTIMEPMLCQIGNLEMNQRGWIIEPKYDGERIIATIEGPRVEMRTRRELNCAGKFPEIVRALKEALPQDCIVDGELGVNGDFGALLMRNVHKKIKIDLLSRLMPATYYIFDILKLGSRDLRKIPLMERKKILSEVLMANERVKLVKYVDTDAADFTSFKEVFRDCVARGREGIIAKRKDSVYDSGKRAYSWLKMKSEEIVDVVIVGATRSDVRPFKSLVMEKNGEYFGLVGGGFKHNDFPAIMRILKDNEIKNGSQLPAEVEREIQLRCRPLPAEIKITEMFRGSPRAPVFKRLRLDLINV